MTFPSPILARLGACLLLAVVAGVNAQSLPFPARPVAAKGPEAKTLIVYSDTHTPYSLADDLAALKLELRRVAGQLEALPAAQASPAKLAAADYIVVFSPQPYPQFSGELLQGLAGSSKPVLWVGYGAEQLGRQPEFFGQFDTVSFAAPQTAATVNYQGHEWNQSFAYWMPVRLNSTNAGDLLMSVPLTDTNKTTTLYPISWKSGHVTFFSALPTATATSPLFSDLLLDFYGVTNAGPAGVCVRIDGYHCHHDHLEFRHLVDYLHEHGWPFTVGVIPAYWNPETKKVEELDTQPEFVAALRYAQKNGGSLVLEGYANARQAATGQDLEFWDAAQDRPYADDSADYVRERVQQGVRQMLQKGLFPVGWETPFNAASRADYAEIARHFSTGVERTQLSDATGLETFGGPAVTQDDFGRTILPENLGVVTGDKAALVQLRDAAERLTQLRGTVATLSYPAYLTEDKLKQAVGLVERYQKPFVDLAAGDHWVQLPDAILLTGNAQRRATLVNAQVTWKAFDRAGNLLASETEAKPASGERVFQRRGKGDYELFEIIEAKP
jgi:uncharacterized protein YdaL